MKMKFVRCVLLAELLMSGASAFAQDVQPEVSYTDDCVVAQIASITANVTEQQIRIKVDLIPKWADKFNLTCLRNIVFTFGGLGRLGFLNPFQNLGAAVCNAIGPIGD